MAIVGGKGGKTPPEPPDAEQVTGETTGDLPVDGDTDDEPDEEAAKSNKNLADFAKAQTRREKEAKKTKDGLAALPPLPRSSKSKPPKPCACGCGQMTKGGGYMPGHDGRPKGWLLRINRGVMKLEDVPKGEREVVAKLLAAQKAALSPGGKGKDGGADKK